jgi:hypothetical protein
LIGRGLENCVSKLGVELVGMMMSVWVDGGDVLAAGGGAKEALHDCSNVNLMSSAKKSAANFPHRDTASIPSLHVSYIFTVGIVVSVS